MKKNCSFPWLNRRVLVSLTIMAIVSIVVYVLCINNVWLGDDLLYKFKFIGIKSSIGNGSTNFGSSIEGLRDILASQIAHYKGCNGRFVAHTFVQLFCGILGQKWFALCNSLVYIVMFRLIMSLCGARWSNYKSLLTVAVLVFLSFITGMSPAFQINYIWMFTLSLGFIWLFFNCKHTNNILSLLGLAIYSFIAGEGHEGINVGIGGAIIVYWLTNIRRFTLAEYVMAIGFGAGCTVLCLAPGNFVRMSGVEHSNNIIMSIIDFLISARTILLLIVVAFTARRKWGLTWRNIYKQNQFYFNIMIICLMFCLALGAGGGRALFGAELMSIIITVRILKKHSFNWFWLAVFGLILVSFWFVQFRKIELSRVQYEDICSQYELSKDGYVYSDLCEDNSSPFEFSYSSVIPLPFGNEDDWTLIAFQKYMQSLYGKDKPLIRVLPKYLQDKDDVELESQVLKCGNGVYLLVSSEGDSAKFYVEREVDLFGIVCRKYTPMEIVVDKPSVATDKWSAKVISEQDYTIMNLSSNRFYLKSTKD